jgi:hypothetical protein
LYGGSSNGAGLLEEKMNSSKDSWKKFSSLQTYSNIGADNYHQYKVVSQKLDCFDFREVAKYKVVD